MYNASLNISYIELGVIFQTEYDYRKKGLNSVSILNDRVNIVFGSKYSIGIGAYTDVNPTNVHPHLYGFLPPKIDDENTVTFGANIFNVLGTNTNAVLYYGYEFTTAGTYGIVYNVFK